MSNLGSSDQRHAQYCADINSVYLNRYGQMQYSIEETYALANIRKQKPIASYIFISDSGMHTILCMYTSGLPCDHCLRATPFRVCVSVYFAAN